MVTKSNVTLKSSNGTLQYFNILHFDHTFGFGHSIMDKLNQAGLNLGRVFNSRCGACHAIRLITETDQLKVET
jgi:hypothetical protein